MGLETKDALLEAINQEFVEAVELLLEHEELIHKDGEAYVTAERLSNFVELILALFVVVAEGGPPDSSVLSRNHSANIGRPSQ